VASSAESVVRAEVEALHAFLVGWFSGARQRGDFELDFLSRFDPDFVLIPPAGTLLTLDPFCEGVHGAYATNPSFRIAIRNGTLRRDLDGFLLATYEEWQRNALASRPPENARIATVVFRDRRPLRWLHVHETWMPAEVASAGPYDF